MKGELTLDQLLEIVRLKEQEDLSHATIGQIVGVSRSTVSRFLNRRTYQEFWENHDDNPIAEGSMIDPIDKRSQHTGSRIIFATAAQNNTYVHDGFLKAIKQFMGYNDADFYVSTFSYKRVGDKGSSEKGSGWYDAKIRDYIVDKPVQLAPGLVWCGEMNIRPTAVTPLQGMHGYAKGNSAIYGHVKQHMETVPSQKHQDPNFMYTTGTITQRNYIQRKAGQKAEFHHIFGGLIIEICDDGRWFVRQVNCESDTGNFYDLDNYYTADGVTTGHRLAGLVPGDIHTNNIHPDVALATLGVRTEYCKGGEIKFHTDHEFNSIVKALRPEFLMAHDILDFKVRNHHNINNPHFRFQQFCKQDESIDVEIANVASLLEAIEGHEDTTPVVVSSNHDRATMRYLLDQVRSWSDDPVNAIFFLRTQLAAYEAIQKDEFFDPVSWNISSINPELRTKWLKQDEPFYIKGIACHNHGDVGPDGARGTMLGFVRMGELQNIGHSHKAGIRDGVHQSGITCRKDPDYAKGPSSWSWSHSAIYPNGKRTMITMHINEDGVARWRL